MVHGWVKGFTHTILYLTVLVISSYTMVTKGAMPDTQLTEAILIPDFTDTLSNKQCTI